MKKILFLFFISFFLFSSCSKDNSIKKEIKEEKQNFYIKTEKLSGFDNKYFLEKTSKISSIGEIFLTSEVFGKLAKLNVKEGDRVSKGQVLASLEDQSGNISIAYKQAKLNLSQAKNSLASSKINLDKAVFDARLNLEKLELNYETLKKNVEENLKQAKNSLENSNLTSSGSKSSLDLVKLDETIAKLEFDYNTKLSSNKETLKSFLVNLESNLDNLKSLTDDVFDFGDKFFYVTNNYSKNNSFDTFFGGKDALQKNNTKLALIELQKFRDNELKNIKIEDISSLKNYSDVIKKGYKLNLVFLQEVNKTVNNSITSVGTLGDAQISNYNMTINSFQGQLERLNVSFVALENNINTFLNTYKEGEESIKKQIELTKKDREILKKSLEMGELNAEVGFSKTQISSEDSLKNMEIAIKNAKNLLKTAEDNRNVTLKTLENNIFGAEIALEKAGIAYSKLNLESPIDGIVSEIFVDIGQSYGASTKIMKIVSDSENELFVYLPIEELEKINVGDEAFISYRDKSFTGRVFSKSNLADKNLNYKVKVKLSDKINFIGGVANVSFKLKASKKLIPINLVNIVNSKEKLAEIDVFSGGIIEQKTVKLGQTFGDKIEFETDLPENTEIITNDISNFDKEKFEIEKVEERKSGRVEESESGKVEEEGSSSGEIEESGEISEFN